MHRVLRGLPDFSRILLGRSPRRGGEAARGLPGADAAVPPGPGAPGPRLRGGLAAGAQPKISARALRDGDLLIR